MDLGIADRRALVCGSSAGLGYACAEALALEGVLVTLNGRDPARLDTARRRLADRSGAAVGAVAGDVATAEGRQALLGALSEPDILVNNAGGPNPRPFLETDPSAWQAALDANLMAPLLLIQAVLPGMRARRWGRIVNITSAMVVAPRPGMELSAAPRAGLTAVVRAVALAASADNVTLNNLLPEKIATMRNERMIDAIARGDGITAEQARARSVAAIAAGRHGKPEEVGAACAFLCSENAGYISGQNLRLDGGSYPGLL